MLHKKKHSLTTSRETITGQYYVPGMLAIVTSKEYSVNNLRVKVQIQFEKLTNTERQNRQIESFVPPWL